MSQKKEIFVLNNDEVKAIVDARHGNPHHILGMHVCLNDIFVNAFLPDAESVFVVNRTDETEYEMKKIDANGFFSVKLENCSPFPYQFKTIKSVWGDDGSEQKVEAVFWDAYSYGCSADLDKVMQVVNGEDDIESGFQVKEVFGARKMVLDKTEGVAFCMNMPGAIRVSVVGDMNGWDNRVNQMRKIDYTNIFELFIPNRLDGVRYKFEALYGDGRTDIFSDPYAVAYEPVPGNASVLRELSYHWADSEYMKLRKKKDKSREPVSIYEVHLPSFMCNGDGTSLSYQEFGKACSAYVKSMGFNYIEVLPLMEYSRDDTWGYDTTGRFAPSSRFGTPEDFMEMVDYLHAKGIGIIMDMVPVMDVDCLMYWIDTYHLDGIRLDDSELIETFRNVTGDRYADVMYDYMWNTNGVHGLTEYMKTNPGSRGSFQEFIQDFAGFVTGNAGIVALSHDETAYGKGGFIEKMPGGYEDKYADLRVFYGLAAMMPGKKLMCMGEELGLFGGFTGRGFIDWSILEFDANKYIQKYVKELNKLYFSEPAMYENDDLPVVFAEGTEGVVTCFAKEGRNVCDKLYVVCNFGFRDIKKYKVKVDEPESYREIFSSDALKYGGEGNNNSRQIKAVNGILEITVPALSIGVFKKNP